MLRGVISWAAVHRGELAASQQMEHFGKVLFLCNPSAGFCLPPHSLQAPEVCHNKTGKLCPINLTVNQFCWAAAPICERNRGRAETSRTAKKLQISFVVHSPYLCIIKQGGASPEYMSDTAPLLATVNMPDKNRKRILKTQRIRNKKDPGTEAHPHSPLK